MIIWFTCSQTFLNDLAFQPFDFEVPDEGYSRNAVCALNVISTFYYYHWVDTSAGELLVPVGIIRPVVNASALTWFNRYVLLKFTVSIIKTKVLLPQA